MSAPSIDPARLERNWQAVRAELDVPAPSRIERFVRRLGFSAPLTRVALATPSLRRAWFISVGIVMFVAVVGGDAEGTDGLLGFLLLAPLIPVLGVSLAYGIEADPAHEIGIATPMRGITLVLTRAAVIVTVSAGILTISALLNPVSGLWAVAWLLPSIALTLTSLAISTWLSPRKAAAATTAGWLLLLLLVRGAATDQLAAFTAPVQVLYLLLAVVAFAIVWQRRDRFDLLAVQL